MFSIKIIEFILILITSFLYYRKNGSNMISVNWIVFLELELKQRSLGVIVRIENNFHQLLLATVVISFFEALGLEVYKVMSVNILNCSPCKLMLFFSKRYKYRYDTFFNAWCLTLIFSSLLEK